MARVEPRKQANGKVSWRISWRLGGHKSGAWQSLTVTSSEKAARQVADLAQAHGHNVTRAQLSAMLTPSVLIAGETVAQFAQRFVESLTIEDGTRNEYNRAVRLHIGPATLGGMDLGAVTREDVRLWIRGLEAKDAAPKSIANYHALLSAALSEAANQGKIGKNPCDGVRLPRRDSHTEADDEMCMLSHFEVKLIAERIGDVYGCIVWILARTGLRWSELTAMQVGDVDLMASPPRLKVTRAWKRQEAGGYKVGPPKTPKSRRTITLDASTFDLLLPLVTARPAGAWLITGRDGTSPLPHSTFDRQWRNALFGPEKRRASKGQPRDGGLVGEGLLEKRPRIHDLRHTHASWLLADPSVSMLRLQRRLGHESLITTEGTYGHLRQDDDAAILGALDRIGS